jgi:hypothetical protein
MDESLNSIDYSDGMSTLHYYIQLNILISQHNIQYIKQEQGYMFQLKMIRCHQAPTASIQKGEGEGVTTVFPV